MKKEFTHMALLIKERRVKRNLSQKELSNGLDYKNGQFISNVERAVCSIPPGKYNKLNSLIGVTRNQFETAYLDDEKAYLNKAMNA